MSGEFTIPGGKQKDLPLSQAGEESIRFWIDRNKKTLADPDREKFHNWARRWNEAATAELRRRTQQGAQPQTQMVKATANQMTVEGSFGDPAKATAALRAAAQHYHLVSPSPVCGSLPDGCELSLAVVQVSIDETYPIQGGKHGLDKTSLNKIAATAGITWDTRNMGRLDDGSDPRYVHYRAIGMVRGFDGQPMIRSGEVEIDMRDGSDQIAEIRESARKRAERDKKPNDGGDAEIATIRKFIIRHAETKAKLRAIADMGVRRSYTTGELQKPFAVAKVMFTGRTSDPRARAMYQQKIADSFLTGTAALFGAPQAQAHAAPGHAPPPVGYASSEPIDDDIPEYDGGPYDAPSEVVTESPDPTPQAQPQSQQSTTQSPEPDGMKL